MASYNVTSNEDRVLIKQFADCREGTVVKGREGTGKVHGAPRDF